MENQTTEYPLICGGFKNYRIRIESKGLRQKSRQRYNLHWKGVNEETTNPITCDAVQKAIFAITSHLIRRISSGPNPMSNIPVKVGYVIYETPVLRIIEFELSV